MAALSTMARGKADVLKRQTRGISAPAVACVHRHWAAAAAAAVRIPAAAAPAAAAAASPLQQRRHQRCAAQRVEALEETAAAEMATSSSSTSSSGLPPLPPLDASYEAAAAFASYANWLLPGRLLVGRYPGVEPSRCATHDQAEAQLEAIIVAGPRVFVCLQAEVPPQAEMRVGGAGGFLPYKAAAELIAASHTPPPPMEVVNGLRNPTLDKFLPKRRRAPAADVEAYYARESVSFLHCPVEDLGVPTLEQLAALVDDLEARLARGESLYVHCWGGRGRAGTVGAALLAKAYGLTADEALERVQRAFDTRLDNKERSPETDEQRALVREFVARLSRNN